MKAQKKTRLLSLQEKCTQNKRQSVVYNTPVIRLGDNIIMIPSDLYGRFGTNFKMVLVTTSYIHPDDPDSTYMVIRLLKLDSVTFCNSQNILG